MADFQELVDRAMKVHEQFPRKWDAKTEFINLVEEVGELSNAILMEHGDKGEKRRRAILEDAFADCLFALIATAKAHHVDLEQVLTQALDEIDARQKQGDYES